MKNKKKQLLLKYLGKKNAQRKRDALLERVRELQQTPKAAVVPTSQIRRKLPPEPRGHHKQTKRGGGLVTVSAEEPAEESMEEPAEEPVTVQLADEPALTSPAHRDGIVDLVQEARELDSLGAGYESPALAGPEAAQLAATAPLLVTSKRHARTRQLEVSLPITYLEDEIVSSIKENYITVILGGTGTGKSTQVPQFVYENGFAATKAICLTQPRRVSTQATAQRIADEQLQAVGSVCGYKMRYHSKVSASTKILVVTEGVLLQELAEDPFLSAYSVVILDEVHERSMISDTLLMILAKLAVKGYLRLVLMSADITAEYLDSVARIARVSPSVLRVEPQRYEVQVHYLPLREYRFMEEMVSRVEQLEDKPGSILAFVATKEETEQIKRVVRTNRPVFTLHSDTTVSEQQAILRSQQALIVATNVAETSLTLPDVNYVIDGGREIQRSFSYLTNGYEYRVAMISQSSATQRLGRTGRTGPGSCYRLYTVVEHGKLAAAKEPEIVRERALLPVAALLKAGVRPANIVRAEFLTAPAALAINKELEQLRMLGVIDEAVTPFGKKVLSLPINPVLGASIVRIAEGAPDSLGGHLDLVAGIELAKHPRGRGGGEMVTVKGTRGGEQSLVSYPALSLAGKEKAAQLVAHLKKALVRHQIITAPVATSAAAATPSPADASPSIAALAWACRHQLVVLAKGVLYHQGEEVLGAPLGFVDSSSPVPLLYFTLTRFSGSKRVYLNPVIIPSYQPIAE